MTASFRDVVTEHHTESDAILVAGRAPCISIAHDEQENLAGRSFRIVKPTDLEALEVPASWKMAVLLCPGDGTEPIADWVLEGDLDLRRIIFYLHVDTDPREALMAWHGAGLHVHATWTIEDWRQLHKHFGAAWNVQIYDDFRRG